MIKNKVYTGQVEIDLTGPQGNAFYLLGCADYYANKLGYSKDEINVLLNDMKKSDYENLITVFDKHFGHFITLYK